MPGAPASAHAQNAQDHPTLCALPDDVRNTLSEPLETLAISRVLNALLQTARPNSRP